MRKILLFLSLVCCTCAYANEFLYKRGFLYALHKPFFVPDHYNQVSENLWACQSLRVTISQDKTCYILGFCVDVENPFDSLGDIVEQLSYALSQSEKDFFEYSDQLCGRYVILYFPREGTQKMITDAVGFRPIYYNEKATFATSHSRLLAINLQKKEISGDKRVSGMALLSTQGITQYPGVFQLDPFFTLELNTGKRIRFFPRIKNTTIYKEEAVEQLSSMVARAIKGLMHNQDKPILLSLTSGLDSRSTLSIMRRQQIPVTKCFTYLRFYNPSQGNSRDNTVAKSICSLLEIPHISVYATKEKPTPDLKEAFMCNSKYKYEDLNDRMTLGMVEAFSTDRYIHLNSNVPEAWKLHNMRGKEASPKVMKQAAHIGLSPQDVPGYSLGAFFLMENQMTRWLTDVWVHTDVVFDTFCPYNCRKIIQTMLRVPADFSCADAVQKVLVKELPSS